MKPTKNFGLSDSIIDAVKGVVAPQVDEANSDQQLRDKYKKHDDEAWRLAAKKDKDSDDKRKFKRSTQAADAAYKLMYKNKVTNKEEQEVNESKFSVSHHDVTKAFKAHGIHQNHEISSMYHAEDGKEPDFDKVKPSIEKTGFRLATTIHKEGGMKNHRFDGIGGHTIYVHERGGKVKMAHHIQPYVGPGDY